MCELLMEPRKLQPPSEITTKCLHKKSCPCPEEACQQYVDTWEDGRVSLISWPLPAMLGRVQGIRNQAAQKRLALVDRMEKNKHLS